MQNDAEDRSEEHSLSLDIEQHHWHHVFKGETQGRSLMFSMTDIKAHTVYKVLFFIPNLLLVVLSIFAYPLVSYMVGFSFVDSMVMKVLLSIVAYFILGFVWIFLVKAISFVLNELFYLVVDVSPSRGLSKEESKAVLFGGQAVLDSWEFDKNVRNVRPDVIERLSRQGLFGFIFKDVVQKRLYAIVDYYQKRPNEAISSYKVEQILKELGLAQSWYEKIINNAYLRNVILQTTFFLYLIIEQPKL